MLDSLRKNQKMIVYIVAAAFILSLGAGGIFGGEQLMESFREKYLGKVNGTTISPQEFNAKVQEVVQRYENQGQTVDETMMTYVYNTAWQELVDNAIWQQQIKKHKIKVSETEIKNAMENEIPPELQQNPNLQTNGRFDKSKYFAALNNNYELRAAMYQSMQEYLPKKKLQDKIRKEAKITADSLKAEYIKDSDSVTGKAVWFDFNLADSSAVKVTDAEVKKYYEANKDKEFKKGPASRLKYVTIPIKPSDQDYNDVKLEIDEIYNRLVRDAQNFADLALEYSEDPGSAERGGSLGRFKRGQMVPEFDKVAFALKAGQISKPFKTQFGWHIVRCDTIFPAPAGQEELSASHILFKVNTTESTRNDLRDQAKDAAKLISKQGIDKAAKELKLEVTTSRWLAHDNPQMEGFGEHGGLYQFMKSKKAGKVSDPYLMKINGEDSYVIAQITDNKKVYYEDFAEKKLQIKFDLEKQKKIALVKAKAENFVKRVAKENYLTAAVQEGWKVIDLKDHKAKSRLAAPVNAQMDDFDKAALALNSGAWSSLITTKEGPFLILAESRNKPNLQAFDKAKQEELRDRLEEAAFNRWFQQLRKDAKIVDNRYKYGY